MNENMVKELIDGNYLAAKHIFEIIKSCRMELVLYFIEKF